MAYRIVSLRRSNKMQEQACEQEKEKHKNDYVWQKVLKELD